MNLPGNDIELRIANNYVKDEQIKNNKWRVISNVPAIFFAKVGAAVMLNRKRLVYTPFLLDNNSMAFVFIKNNLDSYFVKILFDTLDLSKLSQMGAIPSYNTSDVENIKVKVPTIKEQKDISQFFSKLDNLITLHQRT